VLAYFLANYDKIKLWILEGTTLAPLEADGDAMGAVAGSKALATLRAAIVLPITRPLMMAAHMLVAEVPTLVALVSAEHDKVKVDIVERLSLLRDMMESAITADGAKDVRCPDDLILFLLLSQPPFKQKIKLIAVVDICFRKVQPCH
jgi:hypothetical protein